MPQPLVSLITMVCNREQYLSQTIESILSQSFGDFELLIWDDGSTDRAIKIAHHYAAQDKRIRIIAAAHCGRVRALIGAIAQTTAQYIGLVDSDDLLAVTALEKTVVGLETNAQIGLVYTDYQMINEQDQILGYGERCQTPYSKEALLLSFMIGHFRLMRRSVYEQVGGFTTRFPLAEDYDLCLKLSEVTEVLHLQIPLYYRRQQNECLSLQESVQQILYSKQAIEDAMQRRGLDQQYVLRMSIQAHFRLQCKPEMNSQTITSSSQSPNLPSAPIQRANPWALAPKALMWLENFIQQQQIRSIVELGSGQSTIVIAKLQQQGWITRSLTLEHDSYWQQDTCKQLQSQNLLNYAQIQHSPLQAQQVQGETHVWYDTTQIVAFAADLILIDGPPHSVGALARYPALHLLQALIQPGTWVVLDDYYRPAEREAVRRWLQELPTLRLVETLAIDTGLAILQFQAY